MVPPPIPVPLTIPDMIPINTKIIEKQLKEKKVK